MDSDRFDSLIHSLFAPSSRRRFTLGLSGLLGAVGARDDGDLSARKRKRKKGKKLRNRKTCRRGTIKCGRVCCSSSSGPTPTCCPAPTGKVCTNLDSDAANCGACGAACAAGKVCAGGLCWTPCAEKTGCLIGSIRLCEGNNLCVEVGGTPVCAVSAACNTLTDCAGDPGACPAGSACASECCLSGQTCRTPVQ